MCKPRVSVSISLALLTTVLSIRSAAAGDFELGCERYNAKDYQQACVLFEKATKTFPQNWLVHYYLANTYLACKQSARAKREYEACLGCKPNAATAKYCQDVLLKLGGSAAVAADTTDKEVAESESNANKDSEKSSLKASGKAAASDAATQAIIAADQARAEDILRKAQAECKAIRAEAKQKIADGRHTGNQWYVRRDGTQFVDLLDEEKEAITREAEDRCDAIMRTAESRAKPLQH